MVKIFSKEDTTNWSDNFYTTTEIIHDTFLSNRINFLTERKSKNLLGVPKLTPDENYLVMKKLNLLN